MVDALGLLFFFGTAGILLIAAFTIVLVREAERPPRRSAGWAIARSLPCDPAEARDAAGAPYAFTEWTLDRPGGLALPVWDVTTGAAAPAIDTVILVHGWASSRFNALRSLEIWGPRAARVLLYDLRGHGDARGDTSTLGSTADGDDLVELIERGRVRRFVLVGHSMGATIALDAAARTSADGLRGVVAYGPYPHFTDSLRARLRSGGYPVQPMHALAFLWWRLGGRTFPDARASAAAMRVPLLVVHGAEDPICAPAGAEAIVAAAADGRMFFVPGAGHTDMIDVDPQGHAERLDAFLGDLAGLADSAAPAEPAS